MAPKLEDQVVSEDPHANEDPEEHLGDERPDPWSDPEQLDWPNNDPSDDE